MITKVQYIKDYQLEVTFYDGIVKRIDLQAFLEDSTHPLITKFRDKELFKQVRIDYGTICWGDNEFDINPESIYNGEFDVKKVPKRKSKKILEKQLV